MRRLATVLLALAFLLAQSIASGHVHPVGLPQGSLVASADHSAPDLDGDCLICLGLHVAGKLLLPGPAVAPQIIVADLATPHRDSARTAPRPLTAFRSRAPPQD